LLHRLLDLLSLPSPHNLLYNLFFDPWMHRLLHRILLDLFSVPSPYNLFLNPPL